MCNNALAKKHKKLNDRPKGYCERGSTAATETKRREPAKLQENAVRHERRTAGTDSGETAILEGKMERLLWSRRQPVKLARCRKSTAFLSGLRGGRAALLTMPYAQ